MNVDFVMWRFRLRKDIVVNDIKEDNISKNAGTVFHLYLGREDEKEKMEWNDKKIVQSNQLTNQGKKVASFRKYI